jgi:hypothetical protein
MGIFPMRLGRSDLRKAPRHELHFPAYITVGDQPARHTCIIHDISEGGARLTIGTRDDIPDNFTLIFSRNCRVVRRTEDHSQIAVEFLPAKRGR